MIFPRSTNEDYRGSPIALLILGLGVVLTIIPALIHTFLPDGGANTVAGMGVDLESEHGRRVVSLMAWAGVTQLAWGAVLLSVLVRYRSLVPLVLAIITIERLLHCWNLWGPKGGTHHPPEAYATLVVIPLFTLGFILSVRTRKSNESS